jgi:hypothetical protein
MRSHYRADGYKALAVRLNRTRDSVAQMARTLGLARQKAGRWTAEDDTLLEANMHRPWNWLEAKLGRSVHALKLRAAQLQLKRRDFARGFWTPSEVADIFGVNANEVRRWISKGMLQARQSTSDLAMWQIVPSAVHQFIHAYPTAFNIGRVDPISFIDICGGEGLPRAEKQQVTRLQA